MKISIVTPTLNSAKYLRDTIDSITAAFAGLDVEHIIVDGGSVDGTLDIPDPRYSRVFALPKSGMYEAIEFGFSKSSGDVLCWLNSDDRFCPETGRIVTTMFRTHPSAKIISGSCWYIDENGRRLFPKHYLVHQKMFFNSSPSLMLCQPSTFWTREVYRATGGFNHAYAVVADRDFLLRAVNSFGLVYTARPLSEFRIHGMNKSIVEGSRADRENRTIDAALHAGPTTPGRKLLAAAGRYLNIALNPKMVLWKLANGKTQL